MKKDKLYTVDKWNKHLFSWGGDAISQLGTNFGFTKPDNAFTTLSSPTLSQDTMSAVQKSLDAARTPSSPSSLMSAGAGAGADIVGGLAKKWISGGLSSGAGNAVATIGSKIGDMIPNPMWKGIVKVGSGVLGGGINALWGMSTDEKALKQNNQDVSTMRGYTSNASYYDDVQGPESVANFKNIYRGGVFKKNKARSKNEEAKDNLIDAKNYAFNYMTNNVDNISRDQMGDLEYNYTNQAAFGGPLEMMANNDGMGAIEYGLLFDYNKNMKDKVQNKGNVVSYLGNTLSTPMTYANGGGLSRGKNYGSSKKPYPSVKSSDFAGGGRSYPIPTKADAVDALRLAGLHGRSDVKAKVYRKYPELRKHGYGGLLDNNDTFFALGGDLQTNGSDWSSGLVHIDQGGSHEENPYDGVQMGIAPDNTPNLVEEGETIYADGGYVFSNRIYPKKDVLKKFHMYSKGSKLTYADVSKRLEKEIKERPNDPISQASFKKMLEMLMEAQEEQKQEEETERVRKAFEALSPEEQQQVLAQIAAQQQEGQQEVPVDENGNPIDVSQMQQPTESTGDMAGQPTDDSGIVGAEGGKLNHKYDGLSEATQKMQVRNVGTWKNPDENHWGKFVMPGLLDFLQTTKTRLDMAPDDTTKEDIRKEAVKNYNALQQSYMDNIVPTLGKSKQDYSEGVLNHQKMFDKYGGNKGFYTTDDNGNITNLIAGDINLPKGHATDDKPTHWFDGYGGPQTGLRNFGSTEYGDDKYYADAVKQAADLGIVLAPNDSWKYGDNNNRLYGMSLLANETPQEEVPKKWDWNKGSWATAPADNPAPAPTPKTPVKPTTTPAPDDEKIPYKDERWRYIGLLGPALGLGLWGAGVGKPDTSDLTSAIDYAYKTSGAEARAKPIGNYLKFQPMDIWYGLNPMYASARATDRAITNNGTSLGTKTAAQLANGYNTTLSAGNLYRQALEYNDALKQKVFDFNRATDMFNAEAYNKASLTNAELRNRNAQFNAQLAMDAAKAKMEAQAQWYNALYGNIGQLTKAAAGIGTDNMSWNQVAGLYNTGALGKYNPREVRAMAGKGRAKGGKLRKRKGLTF